MAEEGEDPQGNLAEERHQILQLQSEQARKREQLERLSQKRKALKDELDTREAELEGLQAQYRLERSRALKAKEASHMRTAEAESHFMGQQVRKLLEDRIPNMAPIQEEDADGDAGQYNFMLNQAEDANKGQPVHDTVLVSYVTIQPEGRLEDFKVTYRIDKDTTVEQLHRDACAYWGCSHMDYRLCKLDKNDLPQDLSDKKADKLQRDEILSPADQSHVHLVHKDQLQIFAAINERMRLDRERKQREQAVVTHNEEEEDAGTIKTLKHGLGYATSERAPEPFVEALKPWPGVYNLLRNRRREHEQTKWMRTSFMELLMFGILSIFTLVCIAMRNDADPYPLRFAVDQALARGFPAQTSAEVTWALARPRSRCQYPSAIAAGNVQATFAAKTADQCGEMCRMTASCVGFDFRVNATGPCQDVNATSCVLWVGPCISEYNACWDSYELPGKASMSLVGSWAIRYFNNTSEDATLEVSPNGLANISSKDGFSLLPMTPMQGRLGTQGWWQLGDNWTLPRRLVRNDRGIMRIRQYLANGTNSSSLSFMLPNLTGPFNYSGSSFNGSGWRVAEPMPPAQRPPKPVMNFADIIKYSDIWDWLGGPFHYQLFNDQSALRTHFEPVGFLRLRQQQVAETACTRPELIAVSANKIQRCYSWEVQDDTQNKAPLNVTTSLQPGSGLQAAPNATRWSPADVSTADFYGQRQRTYDGSGYKAVYRLTGSSLIETGSRFRADLEWYRTSWLTPATRLLVIELVLANYHAGGYVSANFMLEVSPTGVIEPSKVILVYTRKTGAKSIADGLDIARWIVIAGYVLTVRVYQQTIRKIQSGKTSASYVFSFGGLVDTSIVAIFIAMTYMRSRAAPPHPTQVEVFYGYSYEGVVEESLGVCEALFFLLLMIRFATFARIIPMVYRLVKTVSNSVAMFGSYCLIFVPIFMGTVFLGNSIWGSQLRQFSTWTQSFMSVWLALHTDFDTLAMNEKHRGWAITFAIYHYVAISLFFLNVFVAITVYAYFEVELVEGSNPKDERWSWDQTLDWMLWAPVYSRFTGRKPGACRRLGYDEEGDEDDEDEDEDDDD